MITGMLPGSYTLDFGPSFGSIAGEQWWGGQPFFTSATFFPITDGSVNPGFDIVLSLGNVIEGTVTDTDGNPLENVYVLVYGSGLGEDNWDSLVAVEVTDVLGNYTVENLPTAGFKVAFSNGGPPFTDDGALGASDPYASQWYSGQYSYLDATAIGLFSPGTTAPGVDVQLESPTFADVSDPNSIFYNYIEWMSSAGISTGTSQPSGKPLYKPVTSVSRQAMAAFLYRLSGATFVAPVESTFADVDNSNPFYLEIEWMAAEGISTGTPQPSGKPLFNPGGAVSRQSMALFLARYAHADISVPPVAQSFADVPTDSSPAAAITWMAENGISTGTPAPPGLPLYSPSAPVSRQAMAAFLYRLAHLGP
jgi:S-layer homology domain